MCIANLRRFAADESGATAVEYGLVAFLVSIATMVAFSALGAAVNGLFTGISGSLTNLASQFGTGSR